MSTKEKWLRAFIVNVVVMTPWLLLIRGLWGLFAALAANLIVAWAAAEDARDAHRIDQ